MFHNLIRIFHDGILLTEGENIVFANLSLEKIFELKHPQ